MPRFRYLTTDVFTDRPFGGNQLAVFPDARGIPEHRLQHVAREFNYSETTFVFPPSDPGHTRRVRIFTPGNELPFAGHPTVGTAHVLAAIGDIPLTGERTRIVLEELVGPVPVTIRSTDGVPTFCELSVAKLPEEGPPAPSREALAQALSLAVDDVLDGEWAPRGWTCGVPYLFIPVRDVGAVARSRVDPAAWERTLAGTWAPEVFVFAHGAELAGSDLHGRMYAPGFGIAEDPATGSAAAALAGYLARRDARTDGTLRWRLEQGFEMGRPSILDIEADVAGGAVTGVRVGGSSVIVCEGTMVIEA
jgi:trans-2,3-dihydro-3-hydroxyanthranilate isomerase